MLLFPAATTGTAPVLMRLETASLTSELKAAPRERLTTTGVEGLAFLNPATVLIPAMTLEREPEPLSSSTLMHRMVASGAMPTLRPGLV